MRALATVIAVLGVSGASVADDNPPALDAAQLPPGTGWWCYGYSLAKAPRAYDSSACFRARARCTAAAEDDRRSVLPGVTIAPSSFQCTGAARVAAFTARGVASGEVVHHEFANLEQCLRAQRSFGAPAYDRVSPCTPVGDLAGTPFRADLIPEGTSWFCGALALSSGPSSLCRRTRDDCTAALTVFRDQGTKVGACQLQTTAFAMTAPPDRVWVFGSEELCANAVEDVAEASRCVQLFDARVARATP